LRSIHNSDSNSRAKKKNKKRNEKSPSPLTKRIDFPESSYQFNQNFEPMDDHELKVKKFLEMGRDEDDYEEKVRQLFRETEKHQKSKEEKMGKKKKKNEKKSKKE